MTKELKSNEQNFRFYCAGYEEDVFQVLSFSGDEALSKPYEINVRLTVQNIKLKPAGLNGLPAMFLMFRYGAYFPYSGIIRQFHQSPANGKETECELLLVPRFAMLDLQRKSFLFRKLSYPDVIRNVLSETGLDKSTVFDIARTYPRCDHVQQEGESDFHFVSRLMEEAGLWYYFKESPLSSGAIKPGCTRENLFITDKPGSFVPLSGKSTLPYNETGGMVEHLGGEFQESVSGLSSKQDTIPGKVVLKNYNSDQPDIKLLGESEIKGGSFGTVFDYTTHNFRNIDEAKQASEIEASRFLSRQCMVEGLSNCRGFRAGHRFSITDAPGKKLDGDYVLDSVHFMGGTNGEYASYSNRFTAIPMAQLKSYAPQMTALKPRIEGTRLAVVESNGSKYPLMDEQGRVPIRFLYDLSGAKNSEASKYVRVAQQMSGNGTGIQFPLHEGTVVAVSFINGDPDRPIISYTIPNASNLPPVKGENKTENIIRTYGKNELLMTDEEGKQIIRLSTVSKQALEMNVEKKYVALQSEKQSFLKIDDTNTRTELTRGKSNFVLSEKSGEEGATITLDNGLVLRSDSKNDRHMTQTKSGVKVDIDGKNDKVMISTAKGKVKFTIDGQSGDIIAETDGNVSFNCKKDFMVKAANIMFESKKDTTIKSTGKITATGTGAVSMESKTAAFGIKGMDVTIEAMKNLSILANVAVKIISKMQLALEGMKFSLGAKVLGEIKALLLKLN